MYIPMGGSQTSAWNVFPIFTFVALWHDFEWKMLAWGWLIALFLIPELVLTWYAKKINLHAHPHYRHICAVAGALNLCNLLGFALGIDGTREMMSRLFTITQIPFVISLLCFYFANVQIAFEVREEEKRRGLYRNF
jgi:D-alanyl-lipoteichoic acid acyltransferase DltB (MBOAT superfamily)